MSGDMWPEKTKEQLETEELRRKIVYETVQYGTNITVTAYLPPGFTMGKFTLHFDLRHAKDLKMTEPEYIQYMQQQLFKKLIERLRDDTQQRGTSIPEKAR